MKHTGNKGNSQHHQFGLSLVELMVSIALALFLLGQVVQVVINGKRGFVLEQEMSQIQENARFAIDYIARDIRNAGYTGCSAQPGSVANSVGSGAGVDINIGLQGYEHGDAAFLTKLPSTIAALDGDGLQDNSDAIQIGRGGGGECQIEKHVAASATFHCETVNDFKKGEILLVADAHCNQIGIMEKSDTNNNGTKSVSVHNTGGSNNCTKKLWGDFDCNSSGSAISKPYGPGSQIMRWNSNTYFVADSLVGSDVPALWRESILDGQQELVQGIERLEMLYGVDTTGDNIANTYKDAETVDTADEWEDVISVRLSLLMRSNTPVQDKNTAFIDAGGFEGIAVAADRFLRQRVTQTIQVRNRGLL